MSYLSYLRATFSLNPARRRARQAYFATGDRAIDLAATLEGPQGRYPSQRARILSGLAALERQLADHADTGWGTNGQQDEEFAHLHTSADLLTLIADTEVAGSYETRQFGRPEWEQAFGSILDGLAEARDLGERAALMTHLYIHAHHIVGSEAAETLAMVRGVYVLQALRANNVRTATISDAQPTRANPS